MFEERKPSQALVSVHCGAEYCGYNTDGYCQKDYILVDDGGVCEDIEEEDAE